MRLAGSRLLGAAAVLALTVVLGCSAQRRASATPGPSPLDTSLDAVFTSPSGLYTIRYNHAWPSQQLPSLAGLVDYFKLPNATFAVATDRVLPGTTLDAFVQATLTQYTTAKIQSVQRVGTVGIGGGRGVLLHALTYVTPQGVTVATPPSAGAQPRNLYQAFYLAGEQSFTFSIAWPRDGKTDYLDLFRSLLETFTLAGAT